MRPGDLLLIFFIWYAVVRFALETLRSRELDRVRPPDGDARLDSCVIVVSVAVLLWRHRPGAADGDRWGEPPGRDDGDEIVEEIDDDFDDDGVADEVTDDQGGVDGVLDPADPPRLDGV